MKKRKCLALLLTFAMVIGMMPSFAIAASAEESHTHTESCYAQAGDLLCDIPESEGHVHSEDCKCPGGEYICGQIESEGHVHDESCYEYDDENASPSNASSPKLICAEEESEGHTHTADCVCPGGEYICGLKENEGHTHTAACYTEDGELSCNETVSENVVEAGDYSAIKAAVEQLAASESEKSGTIRITSDIALIEQITIPKGVKVTIIDNGENHKLYKSDDAKNGTTLFVIEDGAEFTIDGDLTLLANKDGNDLIKCHGKFTLENGTLDFADFKISGGCGIVSVWGKNAEFTMEGGRIQNADINACSAGVRVCGGGSFTMNGGTISGIKAGGSYESGAVLVFACDNSSSLGEGTASFTMNDGIIENNSGYRGAGVFVIGREFKNRASMTMNGGKIRNNTCQGFSDAQGAGAGVYVQQNAEFTMNDGEISGNIVDMGEGGGICVACGWESVAGTPGWNINLFSRYYPAAFTMNGGTIRNNQAKMNTDQGDNGCGGGIYVASHRVTLNGGVIENNTAEKQGGGVYVGATPYILKIHNAVVKENHASVLGGGLWACPTGDVELFVTNGAALYDNTSDGAGDDLVSVKIPSKKHALTLADRALGGGQVFWHKDGGVDNSSVLGPPDHSPRYSAAASTPMNPIQNYGDSVALKAIMSDGAKAAAMSASSLIIQGNEAPRGGGIGTNGGVILGDEREYDYTLQVQKTWTDAEDNRKVPVTVYLKSGENILDPVTLNEENGWTASFTGLPDPKTLKPLSYAVVEDPVPENFTPSYTPAEIDEDARTILITVDNRYTPSAATGSLTISKKVTGTGIPDADTLFEFTVTKDGAAAVGQYSVDGGATQTIPADGKISLKAGQSAVLTGLELGEYTVTETSPTQANYKSTSFSVNNGEVQNGLSATVTVTAASVGKTGGWKKENGTLVKDEDGYFTYTITSDQIDADGNITVDCDALAEYMEAQMRDSMNWSSCNFKVKFVNETGSPIQYKDYSFDTVNWLPVGDTYVPSTNPSMLNTNEGAGSYSAGYGWGEVWQQIYPMLIGQKLTTATLNATGFDGKQIRVAIAPLRCINPAVVSYFKSNPGNGTLTGNSNTNSAQTITLLQMNALPELIKQAFTFENCEGTEISLTADDSRTYADFICAFYGVQSLNELTVAQKYNVFGTGYKGSPAMPYAGQSHITTYYANTAGNMANWCIPYAVLNDGTLDYFKTWGFSDTRIEEGKKLQSGGQIFSADDAALYAYQPDYYLMETDPEVLSMAYEYLYDRCIRFTLDADDRPISTAIDNSATSNDSVGGIKDYMNRTDAATANVLKTMNNGAAIEEGDSITLDNVKGYIEVPNAWNQFRYYDFGFQLIFESKGEKPAPASVAFTNTYEKNDTPEPSVPGEKVGNLTVSKTISGNGASSTKAFTFTVTLTDKNGQAVSGTFGDAVFDKNGQHIFTLKAGENKAISSIPAGTKYAVAESDNSGYTVTVNNTADVAATGTIMAGETAVAAFNNYKSGGGGGETSDPSPAKVNLTATKTLDGKAPSGSAFSFVLKDKDGNIVQTKNNQEGSIAFDSLSFSAAGTYTYYIAEQAGTDANINYDATSYKVTITVTRSGDYKAAVNYEKNGQAYDGIPVFVNTTKADDSDKPNTPTTPDKPNTPVTPDKPKNPIDTVPQTGDISHIGRWAALACLSWLAMAIIIVKKRVYANKLSNTGGKENED